MGELIQLSDYRKEDAILDMLALLYEELAAEMEMFDLERIEHFYSPYPIGLLSKNTLVMNEY